MSNIIEDKIWIEKKERIRLVISHKVGLSKVINSIRKDYKVTSPWGKKEIIIFVEEKDEEQTN